MAICLELLIKHPPLPPLTNLSISIPKYCNPGREGRGEEGGEERRVEERGPGKEGRGTRGEREGEGRGGEGERGGEVRGGREKRGGEGT